MAFPDYPNPRAPQDPLAPPALSNAAYRLTREEIQVLKQCNKESFYGRCVPLMTAFGLGAYYGVHLGYLKASPKYGSTPKIMLGLLIGFIGGKISYKQKCEDKILALPGGKLKESILMRRKARDGLLQPFDDSVYTDASISYAMPYIGGNLQSGEAKSISELDTDRPYDSFDDSFRSRPDVENEIENLPTPPPSRAVTYDELRQKNREEYESRRKMYRSGPLDDYAPYSGAFAPPPVVPRDDDRTYRPPPAVQPVQPMQESSSVYVTQPSSIHPPTQRPPPQRKNLYGDVVEK